MYFIQSLKGMLLLVYYYLFRKSDLNLIFPEDNIELNQNAIDLACFYTEYSHVKNCNLIIKEGTIDRYDFTKIKSADTCNFNIISEKANNIFFILKYLVLLRESPKNIIVSFNYPFKTNNQGLLKKNNITLKELVCYDIYHLTYIPEDIRS